jgi:hypothetical protein
MGAFQPGGEEISDTSGWGAFQLDLAKMVWGEVFNFYRDWEKMKTCE